MGQFQRAYSLFLHTDVVLFHYIHWADFLDRTKPQGVKVLSGLVAGTSRALSCLDANPPHASTHASMAFSTCQRPHLHQMHQCLQCSAKVHPAALHFWQRVSAEHGNDPIHLLSTAFVHVLATSSTVCCEKRENWITSVLKAFSYPSASSSQFLTILISKCKVVFRCNFSKQPNTRAYNHFLSQPFQSKIRGLARISLSLQSCHYCACE